VIRFVVQTNENYLKLNLDSMANAVAVASSFFQFSQLSNHMDQLQGGALPF